MEWLTDLTQWMEGLGIGNGLYTVLLPGLFGGFLKHAIAMNRNIDLPWLVIGWPPKVYFGVCHDLLFGLVAAVLVTIFFVAGTLPIVGAIAQAKLAGIAFLSGFSGDAVVMAMSKKFMQDLAAEQTKRSLIQAIAAKTSEWKRELEKMGQ